MSVMHRVELAPSGRPERHRSAAGALAGQHPAAVRFATIRDLDALDSLEAEWDALFESSARPQQVFQRFAWLRTWASIYASPSLRLSIVTGRIDGRLVLVWPLVVQRRFGLRILTAMGEPLSQYADALIADTLDDAGMDAAFAYVMRLPVDVFSFRRVRDDGAVAPLLRRRLPSSNRQASPVVELTPTGDGGSFAARCPGKVRASRRRRRRRLEERGPVTFTTLERREAATCLVAEALALKRQWARQTGVVAPALFDPRFEAFFVAAAGAEGAPLLRVSALRCGGALMGVEISVPCRGHLFGHVLAPHPGFPALGLGGLLAESIIAKARDDGYSTIDLLAPADAYKLEWTDRTVGVSDFFAASSVAGLLYTRVWLRWGRGVAKRIASQVRPAMASCRRRFDQARSSRGAACL